MPHAKPLPNLITAATAVAALAAGLLMALHAPAPSAEDFSEALVFSAADAA